MMDNALVWFRRDLRLNDQPALLEASQRGAVLPIYIFDTEVPSCFKEGSAGYTWLCASLSSLNKDLNGHLNLYYGTPLDIIRRLIKAYKIQHVFWNHVYEPWERARSAEVKAYLKAHHVCCHTSNADYLWAPDECLKDDGDFYKVFTAYDRKMNQKTVRDVVEKPRHLKLIQDQSAQLDRTLVTQGPVAQADHAIQGWRVGESAACSKLEQFIHAGLKLYQRSRDFPALDHTSKLSPHLHFGEISPVQIWHAIQSLGDEFESDKVHFLRELNWREFSNYLLYHFEHLHDQNFKKKFDAFPWIQNDALLQAWQAGLTGYPIIDAGMRELLQTGYMHNRVRMIVASFLVKNLMIDWRLGSHWFLNALFDADLANNSASWQWVAGSGCDAAPYFRIFNPILQGEKFDPLGEYTRKFVPELSAMPQKFLFTPWLASHEMLSEIGIQLGEDYPKPIIDLKASRDRALKAYRSLA